VKSFRLRVESFTLALESFTLVATLRVARFTLGVKRFTLRVEMFTLHLARFTRVARSTLRAATRPRGAACGHGPVHSEDRTRSSRIGRDRPRAKATANVHARGAI
jgi:hypothetical protein